jgi:NAD(P)H-hydrate repair Nnr-like enzyme with NAD(P)H-hydrate dehydratase domain
LAASTAEVQADRIQAARALAERLNAIVILKGAGSLIMRPDGYYHVNTSGGPALSSAGQGDVLTGLVAALLAQGLDGFQAASLAVHAHGLAGDDYARESGGPIGLSASATATRVASVLNRLLSRPGAAPRAQPD